eukprot:11173280-Alexandrium_andersonii.AAC.1
MSVDLPPDSRAEAIAALQVADPPATPLSSVAGINIQPTRPRGAVEARDQLPLDRWPLCALECAGATRRGQ